MARVLLLVPSASYRAGDFLEAALALGVEVVVGSSEALALRGVMGGRSLELPFDDPGAAASAIVEQDRVAPLDAVVAVDDQGTLVAAEASARLGLRHNPPAAVAAARDKIAMRRALAAAEVPQPAFAPLRGRAGEAETFEVVASVGYPCVVKPRDLSGSQGVIRVDDPAGVLSVVERVRGIASRAGAGPSPTVLVEAFVGGAEVAVEGILDGGELTVLAVFDKPDPLEGPYFEETIYVTPSRLPTGELAAVAAAAGQAARALGLSEGPVHAEVRVSGGRASVIEVAARTIGGLCSRTLRFGTGRSLEELVLAQALGLPLDRDREGRAAGVLMLPIPGTGTLIGVEGREEALAVPGILAVETTVAPGRPIVAVPEGDRYLGFVFAEGPTPARVEKALRRAQGLLEVRVEETRGRP
jgi:biotin carboxylase